MDVRRRECGLRTWFESGTFAKDAKAHFFQHMFQSSGERMAYEGRCKEVVFKAKLASFIGVKCKRNQVMEQGNECAVCGWTTW